MLECLPIKSKDALYFCEMMGEETGEIRVVETEDGSRTLYLPGLDETYHSTYGAVTESRHVYIEKGSPDGHEERFKDAADEHVD